MSFVRGKIKGTGHFKFSLRLTGMPFDTNVTVKSMLPIKALLLKSGTLRTSAHHNTVKNFEFAYFAKLDKALIDGLAQNKNPRR